MKLQQWLDGEVKRDGSPWKQVVYHLPPQVFSGTAKLRRPYTTIVYEPGATVTGGTGLRIEKSARGTRLEEPLILLARDYNLFIAADGFEIDGGLVQGAGKTNLLSARGVSDLWARGTTFEGAVKEHNVYLSEGGTRYVIEECALFDAERCGVQVNACPYTAQGLLLSKNEFRGNRSCAAQFSGLWGGVIEGNALSGHRRDFVIWRDQRAKPQCSNADLDFSRQHGRLHWDDPDAQDIDPGSSMVIVRQN